MVERTLHQCIGTDGVTRRDFNIAVRLEIGRVALDSDSSTGHIARCHQHVARGLQQHLPGGRDGARCTAGLNRQVCGGGSVVGSVQREVGHIENIAGNPDATVGRRQFKAPGQGRVDTAKHQICATSGDTQTGVVAVRHGNRTRATR